MSEHEECICVPYPYGDGPDECCPQHGRPYSYWVDGCADLNRRLADAEARAEAAVVEAINRARNEHWQKHLREHPYADAKSCPGDYAAHDAYRHAAQVAIEALRGDQ